MLRLKLAFFALVLGAALQSRADQNTGTVTVYTTDFFPGFVAFTWTGFNVPPAPAPPPCHNSAVYKDSNWLWFSDPNVDKMKAVFATITSAYLSGKPLFIVYDPTTCQVSTIRAS
jgi:hypothetical protein